MCRRSEKYDKMHYCGHKAPQFRTIAVGLKFDTGAVYSGYYINGAGASTVVCVDAPEIYDKMHHYKRYLAQFRTEAMGVGSSEGPVPKRDTEAYRPAGRSSGIGWDGIHHHDPDDLGGRAEAFKTVFISRVFEVNFKR